MEKPLKVRLHIMSPVHIGCDDVYEPTDFVIDEKKGRLIEFEPLEFIKTLSPADRQSFSNICSRGNIASIVEILKFLSNKQINGREVEIAEDLTEHYKRVRSLPINDEKKLKQELNNFIISRTAYSANNSQPFIPGSSVKGALRTAYLNEEAVSRGIRSRRQAKELEIELLGGDFDTDPFRMVKVSDFLPAGDIKTRIVYAVNRKKKPSRFEARGPFQILEVIKEGVFEGVINIEKPLKDAGIGKAIGLETLITAASSFYKKVFDEDKDVFNNIAVKAPILDTNGKVLIRFGRHSGAEAVTIEGNRSIKIMQARNQPPKFLDHATTIWLASEKSNPNSNSGLMPFGWAVLELLPLDIKNLYPASALREKAIRNDTVRMEVKAAPEKPAPQTVLWENVALTYNPGSRELGVSGKKASVKCEPGMAIVPEEVIARLRKGKIVKANVTVEPLGGNAFRIVKVEQP